MRAWALIALFLGLGSPVLAQPACDPGHLSIGQAVTDAVTAVSAEIQALPVNLKAEAARQDEQVPLAAPSAKQVEPSGEASGTEVSRADFPSLLGLGVDLTESAEGVTKVSFTPFSFLTAVKPSYLFDPELYDSTLPRALRRIGGSLSSGGKGEAFDRDGDGTVDEALESKDWGDIVTWEIQVRLYGSRDRREGENVDNFVSAIRAPFIDALDTEARLRMEAEAQLVDVPQAPPNSGCYPEAALKAVLSQAALRAQASALAEANESYNKTAETVFAKVDRRLIVSLVGSGTERDEEFGTDKQKFALRAETGSEGTDNSYTAELSWSETDGFIGAADQEMWKLGLQYSTLIGNISPLANERMTLSFSGAYEMYDNVPSAKHDTIAKANAKLKIPLGEGISFPLSVTWANHRDIITDEKEIQGHFGFTLELSKALQNLIAKRATSATEQR
ncbi:MAG TPA: hypothetical protein VLT87_04225 [Thermoanaerobaculia bacterium]|nr:hypothetical protein [Thermoanaerobaculia bacterium]